MPFDEAEHLSSPEAQNAYLATAFETGSVEHITTALSIIARAKAMTYVAEEAGITREALYKALSPEGDPSLSTLISIAKALGIQITAQVAPPARIKRRAKGPTPERAKKAPKRANA